MATEKTSTREIPFSLAFGAEAMEPAEMLYLVTRAANLDEENNE